jgi:hypothetical protein
MKDRRKQRLQLLYRLREMNVEQARAEHVAAQAELDQRRERAEATQRELEALDQWAVVQLTKGSAVTPELLRQVHLYRGAEKNTLDRQRAEEAKQGELTEAARGDLGARFEELSVVERLAARHAQNVTLEELRRGFVELDEAGIRKHHEAKE